MFVLFFDLLLAVVAMVFLRRGIQPRGHTVVVLLVGFEMAALVAGHTVVAAAASLAAGLLMLWLWQAARAWASRTKRK